MSNIFSGFGMDERELRAAMRERRRRLDPRRNDPGPSTLLDRILAAENRAAAATPPEPAPEPPPSGPVANDGWRQLDLED